MLDARGAQATLARRRLVRVAHTYVQHGGPGAWVRVRTGTYMHRSWTRRPRALTACSQSATASDGALALGLALCMGIRVRVRVRARARARARAIGLGLGSGSYYGCRPAWA